MEQSIEFVEEKELGATPPEVLVEGHEAKCHENLFTGGQRIEVIVGVRGPVRHHSCEGEPFVIGHIKFVVVGIGEVKIEEPFVSPMRPASRTVFDVASPTVAGNSLGTQR